MSGNSLKLNIHEMNDDISNDCEKFDNSSESPLKRSVKSEDDSPQKIRY